VRVAPDAAVATPDAGEAPPPVEEVEEDPPDLAARLDANPFVYIARRSATTAMSIFWNELGPRPFGDVDVELFAVALPGGPSLVCVGDEVCWGIDGEMKWLYVPDDLLLGAYPYVAVVAVMPDDGRVDLELSLDDPADTDVISSPERHVDTFAPDAAPTWAQPWIEWLGDLSGVRIVSGTRPVPYVFVGDGETGQLCVAQDAGYRCGEPVPTGAGQGDVRYTPGHRDFGPTIIEINRNSRLENDDAYYSANAALLFDASDAALPWIATVPTAGYSRTRMKRDDPEAIFPLLDVYLEWEIKGANPRCFAIRRSKKSRAKRYVSDPTGDEGVGERKAKLPRLRKARTVPIDASPEQLSIGSDFAGTWSIGADGTLERLAKCRKAD
jgi:hypothetical protein